MQLISRSTLCGFWEKHPDSEVSLRAWERRIRAAKWATMTDVQAAFPKAKSLNGERARFEIAGGRYRLIAAFDFSRRIAFVKFIGTHAEYDRIDAFTVSPF